MAAAAIVSLASCESTPLDERFKPAGDSFEPQRTVLIEEYTGQKCVNCPEAHKLLKELEARFNSDERVGVISVGIHIPMFGTAAPVGYVAPEADRYSEGVESAPSARINRRTEVLTSDQWTGKLIAEVIRKAPLEIDNLKATLNADGKSIAISGDISVTDEVAKSKLQLWLVEDDITGLQLLPGNQFDFAYNHHSVFRAAINGINGQDVSLTSGKVTPFEITSYPLADYVTAANLRVVAFVYNDNDGVLNAAHVNVKSAN